VAEAKAIDMVDVVDAVDAVEAVEAVEAETATRVSAPIAKLTVIPQMHAENGNALRREITAEERTSEFATRAGFQATSKLIVSPTNV
jgi:hypothetical protein